MLGLYLISWLTFLWMSSDLFAQSATVGWSNQWWFGVNEENSAGINGIAGAGTDAGDGIIGVFKSFINYALWLLALIAFAMLLWGGYRMVVSGWDEEAYKEWLKILKNAAIGIAFIAISWSLVSFIFYVIDVITN